MSELLNYMQRVKLEKNFQAWCRTHGVSERLSSFAIYLGYIGAKIDLPEKYWRELDI